MATIDKATVKKFVETRLGGLDTLAHEYGAYKIYESDMGYHTAASLEEEQAILRSPHVRNPRLVWQRK